MTKDQPVLTETLDERVSRGEITAQAAEAFRQHVQRVDRDVYAHRVIQNNPYTKWFKKGEANTAQVRDLVTQFSVFSNHFIPLEAKRMVNAATEAEEMEARAILGSEIGVAIDVDTGSIEGRRFSHNAAHIKWLRDIGEMLGLDRNQLGKWALGSPATHQFLKQLEEVYGSPDNSVGAGASFAIESWAGFGIGKGPEAESNNFWKELITGLERYNQVYRKDLGLKPLNVGFFRLHFGLETGHVANVEHELSEAFFAPGFDAEKWFFGADKALEAILVFWEGLDRTRRNLEA
jgi:pyrroloquinoline quinone (PQQ) biosynthesis protein C